MGWSEINDGNDITMEQGEKLPYSELTGKILNCCFEVVKELGPGFVESIYKNALLIAMRQKWLKVSQLPIGLLVNFRRGKLEWKRLQNNEECVDEMEETSGKSAPF
jgi:hypothetical protein